MAYVVPTPADLQKRFPVFAGVDNDVVQTAITEATRRVDVSWTEGDYNLALMLLAAHYLILDGQGTGQESQAFLNGAGEFKSMSSGSLSLTRFDRPLEGYTSPYDATSYGRRFRELLRMNKGGPVAAVS